ncbi:MAG TPA: LysR family transcriptional regulator [Myxococcaceae bacterium]|nr:LysR family transcriptional regulator [Myxococcaceae bacterium]
MDRIRAMELFVRVVETGSFTAAASALRLSRTRATTEIQQLEAHLGVRLLQRTTRRVSPTGDGALYYEEVRRLLRELRELEAGLGAAAASARGRLRVDVPAAAGREVIAPALPKFLERHPEISLELGSTDRPVNLVAEGVDCVVRGGDVHDDTLVGRRLADLPVVTCAAPAYLERHGKPRTPYELGDHVFVNFFSARTGRVFEVDWTPPDGGASVVLRPRHVVAANDAGTWIALAAAGLGIVQAPLSPGVRERIRRRELRVLVPGWRPEPLPTHVLYLATRVLPARVRVWVDWLVELYSDEGAAAQRFLVEAERGAARRR